MDVDFVGKDWTYTFSNGPISIITYDELMQVSQLKKEDGIGIEVGKNVAEKKIKNEEIQLKEASFNI